MQSQRKTLSSGVAASSRSVKVRSAGAVRAVTTLIGTSVCCCAEGDTRVEVGLAAHEPAGHLGERAGVDDEPEALAGCIGNGDEHGVGACLREHRLDLHQPAEHRHAL